MHFQVHQLLIINNSPSTSLREVENNSLTFLSNPGGLLFGHSPGGTDHHTYHKGANTVRSFFL